MQQSKNEENHSANPIGIGRDTVWDKGIPLYGIAKRMVWDVKKKF